MSDGPGTADSGDFSLVLGGPLYQLFQRTRMAGNTSQLTVVTLLPVAPLLLTMIPLKDLLERLLKIVF